MLNFIIGYLIIINAISMIPLYADMKNLIKLEEGTLKFIYVILGIIGGSVGILVTSQMFGYKKDDKEIKRIIPLIIFLEVIIISYFFIKEYQIQLL